jgi:hypothetical protein
MAPYSRLDGYLNGTALSFGSVGLALRDGRIFGFWSNSAERSLAIDNSIYYIALHGYPIVSIIGLAIQTSSP